MNLTINHGEKWTPAEDDFIRNRRMRGGWKAIAKKLGRTEAACKRRLENLVHGQSERVIVSKEWDAQYLRGQSDYPRQNPPSQASMHDYCAYMAGWNDVDMGYVGAARRSS